MENVKGVGDVDHTPAALLPCKDRAELADVPLVLEAVAEFHSGYSEQDFSNSVNVVRTLPPIRTLAPTDGEKLSIAGVAGSNSGSSRELSVREAAVPSDKLVQKDSCTNTRVEECLRTALKQAKEVKHNLDTVCQKDTRCGQKAANLCRQRDQARERAQRLDREIRLEEVLYSEDLEFLFKKVGKLKEKNRRLSAVNRELSLHVQELLSRHSRSSLSDTICFQVALELEAEQLRQELLLKEEELQSLDTRFRRFREASQKNYLAAIEDIMNLDATLHLTNKTLEAEVDVVSGCPALLQLMRALRGSGGTEVEAIASTDN